MEDQTCFICMTEGDLYRVCRCNTRVHSACFARLVAMPAHSARCAVCQCPYDPPVRTRCNLWRSLRAFSVMVTLVGFLLLQHWLETDGVLVAVLHIAGGVAVMMTFVLLLVIGPCWETVLVAPVRHNSF